MTDARAYSVLLNAISDITPGTTVTADTCREAFDSAALTSAERSGAFRTACHEGFLRMPCYLLDDGMTLARVQIKSTHEAGKGRYLSLYKRTSKPVPAHPCEVAS